MKQRPTVNIDRIGFGYIRADDRSPLKQDSSVARQQTACRLLAAAAGVVLAREFVDRGASNLVDPGPAFGRLISAIEQQRGGAYVLLESADRLAPESTGRRRLEEAIAAAGGQVLELESVRLTRVRAAA